jgi:hypothetical protein
MRRLDGEAAARAALAALAVVPALGPGLGVRALDDAPHFFFEK